MATVLILSIGPVQDFIASARRFRDLWFGSMLLSELSKVAALAIADAEGLNALVFPAPKQREELLPNSDVSVANKIVAKVEGDAKALALTAEAAVRAHLRQMASEAFDAVRGPGFRRDDAMAQIDDLLEVNWAFASLTGPYDEIRRSVEIALGARKRTRTFLAVGAWRGNRPKSSLDGLREAVIDISEAHKKDSEWLYRHYGLRVGENLCGVGLLKRRGAEEQAESVPSTSHVAALAAAARTTDPSRARSAADEYLKTLLDLGASRSQVRRAVSHEVLGHLAGHAVFEERLLEVVPPTATHDASRALAQFLRASGLRPQPYYAVLLADGDRMGKEIDRLKSPDDHRDLTRRLVAFNRASREVVEAHEGHLIYAGGDDVLALLPIHRAVRAAEALRQAFLREVNQGREVGKETPDLSVGIAVGHQLDPAGETLDLAREAERYAKERRESLGLIVNKRGGAPLKVRGKWTEGIVERLGTWAAMLEAGDLPDGAAYELRQLAEDLVLLDAGAAAKEARRILLRKRDEEGRTLDPSRIEWLLGGLGEGERTVERLANELIAARIFAGISARF